jgi:hypothetical protein
LVRKVLAGIRKARGGRLVDLDAYRRAQIDTAAAALRRTGHATGAGALAGTSL